VVRHLTTLIDPHAHTNAHRRGYLSISWAAVIKDKKNQYWESASLYDLDPVRLAERARAYLASIVENSDDAIITKDLDGIITSWNRGAERLFGYSGEEVLGEPITIVIPDDRLHEEKTILSKIATGERVHHYETLRRRKNGSLVPISLTVSPLRDERGVVVGASKIARDISERVRMDHEQQLLLREMNHRVKNAFSLAISFVQLCARTARSPSELAEMASERLSALANAHSIVSARDSNGDSPSGTFFAMVRAVAQTFDGATPSLELEGDDVPLSYRATTPLALVVHELFTNAIKHGALGPRPGKILLKTEREGELVNVRWLEFQTGVPPLTARELGFGSSLTRTLIEGQLGGSFDRAASPEGLTVSLSIPYEQLVQEARG
jgi:PAS domain S-box-containing protein